jgi:tetratricopeptide (TPR) repeat protein
MPVLVYFSGMKTKLLYLSLLFAIGVTHPAFSQKAEDFYNEGVKLKDEKKSAQALEEFKKAIALKPDYTAALYELGWCQNDQAKYTDAIVSLRKARQSWPTIPKVYFELGYAFDKTGKIDSAKVNYKRCLELKSDYSLAHKRLGYLAYDEDDAKTALDYFSKYEIYTKSEITDYLYWYRKGFCNNAVKEYAKAKEALNKSLEFKKDHANIYLELGFASSRLKQNYEAIDHYKKAMEIDPKSHVAYNGIGEVYRDNSKDRDEAMLWYQKSLAIKPKERKACYGMGYCLNSKGKYSEAVDYLKTAIEQESTYTAAYVELGYSYYALNRNTEALDNFKIALQQNPLNENARYYSGLVYIKQGNKKMAQQMVDELRKISSKNADALQQKVDKM